jgi:multicomponent Na+:H+ antiporter subunit A
MGALWLIILGFVIAPFAPRLAHRWPVAAGWILAALPAAIFAWGLTLAPGVFDGRPVAYGMDWAPQLGLRFSFLVDALGLLFTLLISGIGVLVFIYAGSYMVDHPLRGRFMAFLLMFMSSMLGVVLADNMFNVYVFWELTSVSSFLLIGLEAQEKEARTAAWRAMLVTVFGGLALLAGMVLLGQATGTFELSAAREAGPLADHALYTPILVLILLAAFTKSAQFPFHFWLPGAMAAPTPVSAYLHSSTMVTAGVYLLARLAPNLAGTESWRWALTVAGALSIFIGAIAAIRQTELKKLLVFTTIGALGVMVMLLGIGTTKGVSAAVAFLVAHAFYKAGLFMMAGATLHMTHESDVRGISGLRRISPVLAVIGILAAASMVGLPGFLAFPAKEAALKSLEEGGGWVLRIVLATGAASYVLVGLLVGVRPFWGRLTHPEAHGPGFSIALGPAVCAILGIALSLVHDSVTSPMIGAAARSINPAAANPDLAIWHGVNVALLLSIAAVTGGVLLYLAWKHVYRALRVLDPIERVGPGAAYEGFMLGVEQGAKWHTRIVQNGYLRVYILVSLVAAGAGILGTLIVKNGLPTSFFEGQVYPYEVGLATMAVLGAGTAAVARNRLTAIVSLGVVGYAVAMLFVVLGAPDLAMVQIAIDTMTVVVFALMLYHLPDFKRLSWRWTKLRDAGIGALVGGSATLLLMGVDESALGREVAQYYLQNSAIYAHGRNVVNVILVDFRALDTMGEATVVAVAAIGVTVLLSVVSREGRRKFGEGSPILETSARYLTPFISLFAVVILLQGHNRPGGGFLGGLLAGAAIALHSLAFGARATASRLRLDYIIMMAAGLGLMLFTAFVSFFFGEPMLTGHWLLGEYFGMHLGTPVLFDTGIFFVVVGVLALLTIRLVRA